ncbi:MAG: deoxyribonuclease IV [Lachnospiraceae bacterium]
MILGSHVGMSGKEMFLGSAKEAVSYGANTLMVYTGAPQNTRRKDTSECNLDAGWHYLKENGIEQIVIHAPYIINLANTVKPDIFTLAVEFLEKELQRSIDFGSKVLVLHPGSHVGEGADKGIAKIIEGLNAVMSKDMPCKIALETMAGKGSELGRSFEELASIYDGVKYSENLRVCFDTCHTHDAGYDIKTDFDGVIEHFDRIIGKDQIAVFHINDSKNPQGSAKDRHANLGEGYIGFEALYDIVHHPDFITVPKILETPWIPDPANPGKTVAPYKEEIERLRSVPVHQ